MKKKLTFLCCVVMCTALLGHAVLAASTAVTSVGINHTHTAETGSCYTPEYHTHKGNTTSGGLCYQTINYHKHSGSESSGGTCYQTPNYHQHSGDTYRGGACFQTINYHQHQGNSTNGGLCYQTPNYHKHSGSESSGGECYQTPNYHKHSGSTSSGGTCYQTVNYHKHSGDTSKYGGCYITPQYHQHSGSPYTGGGCYVPHTHSGTAGLSYANGCYTVAKTTDAICTYRPCNGDEASSIMGRIYDGRFGYFSDCSQHSATHIRPEYWEGTLHENCGQGYIPTGAYRYCYGCASEIGHLGSEGSSGTHTYQITTYECGSTPYVLGCGRTEGVTVDSYALGCNKTTSTIDSYSLSCKKTASTIDNYSLSCKKTASTIDSYSLSCKSTSQTIDSYSLSCKKTASTIDNYSLSCKKTTSTIDSYSLSCKSTSSTIDKYNLKCTKGTSQVAKFDMVKDFTSNSYKLSISTASKNNDVTITGYKWNTGATSSSLVITANGTYSCEVTISDGSITKKATLSYKVTDYDVEPPVVSNLSKSESRVVDCVEVTVTATDNYGVVGYQLTK